MKLGNCDKKLGWNPSRTVGVTTAFYNLQESKYFPQIEAQGAACVQYSDDVIVASNNDGWVPDLTITEQGIIESKEKSF